MRIDPASVRNGAAVEERLQDMSVANGPDFICIGMQKAGTGWVFDQLQYHPDFWMPPIKELHYLDRDTPKFGNAKKKLRKARKSKNRKKEGGKPIDMARYGRLFRFRGPLLSGDVTPGYSGMREEVIADVANDFPDVKVFLLVRDPVTRLWSQISMANRREKFDRSLLKKPRKFRDFLDEYKPFQKVGFPARIAERWERCAPKVQFQHFFFDDIAGEPHETRRRIIQYLGADPDKNSGELKPEHNRKASAEKLELSDDIKAEIADFFKDELRAAAARFGGHATAWPSLYGL